MCNKGAHCDRSLCFFAHHPRELRSYPASASTDVSATTILEERVQDSQCDGTESASSTDINLEKCVEEMKSSASLTSVADSFRSTYDRFQDNALSMDKKSYTVESTNNDYPPSLFLNNNLLNIEVPPETQAREAHQMSPVTAKPQVASDFSASADICQLLSHSRSATINNAQPSNDLLQKSLSAGQAPNLSPNLSPTCHFSGLPGEILKSSGIQTLPTCPAAFDLIDMNAAAASSRGFPRQMQATSGPFTTPHIPTQNSLFRSTHLAPMAAANSHSFNQATDSFPSFNQDELLAQNAALQNLASSAIGGSSHDVQNVQLLQLLKLHILYNMQGGLQAPPSLASAAPLFGPVCSPQDLMRDQLYSLQQNAGISGLVHSNGFFP